jgi:transposase InsO family protein
LKGIGGRPKWRRPHPDLISTDIVDRQFRGGGLDQLRITDITEHHVRDGKVYCAVVLDVCSRRVVGWSIQSSPTAALATNALGMAIDSRRPPPGAIIHGVQFGSWLFTRRVKGYRHRERTLGTLTPVDFALP